MELLFRFKTAIAQWLMGHGIVWILVLIHRLVIWMENASMDVGMDTSVQGGSFDWYEACCTQPMFSSLTLTSFLSLVVRYIEGVFPCFTQDWLQKLHVYSLFFDLGYRVYWPSWRVNILMLLGGD